MMSKLRSRENPLRDRRRPFSPLDASLIIILYYYIFILLLTGSAQNRYDPLVMGYVVDSNTISPRRYALVFEFYAVLLPSYKPILDFLFQNHPT